jgi:hypothetical protein
MSARVRSAFAQGTGDEPCVRMASRGRGRAAQTRRHTTGALRAQHETSFVQATGAATTILTIDRGGKLVARLEMQRARDGSVKMTTTYGAEIKGPRSITLDSPDGRSFQRTVDGQRSTAAQPQKAPQIEPALQGELRSLFAEMKSPARNCRREAAPVTPTSDRPAPPNLPLQKPPTVTKSGARSLVAAAPPGTFRRASFDWHLPQGTFESPACDTCEGDQCNDNYDSCLFDAENLISTIFSIVTDFGPQLAGKVALCLADYGVCLTKCQTPGHGCCPSQCGSLGECCGENEKCMLPLQKTCCPPNHSVCRGVCCEQGVVGCAPDGFCACPQGQTPCGDSCCPTGNICCGGSCCAANSCNNGTCTVVPPQASCGGAACVFGSCCGGKCCFGTCLANTQCCPPGQGCGNACCAPGQTCTDSTKGICTSPTAAGCPAGQVQCTSHQPGAAAGVNTQICCASNVTCCFSRCCAPGQECCDSGCSLSCVH